MFCYPIAFATDVGLLEAAIVEFLALTNFTEKALDEMMLCKMDVVFFTIEYVEYWFVV
jgi:hypothetical protein